MGRKKYTLYVLDKDNCFLKDCLHDYFETVKPFNDHFSKEELRKIKKIKKDREKAQKKIENKKLMKKTPKPHRYQHSDSTEPHEVDDQTP